MHILVLDMVIMGAHAYGYCPLQSLCDASGPRGGGVFEGGTQTNKSQRYKKSGWKTTLQY